MKYQSLGKRKLVKLLKTSKNEDSTDLNKGKIKKTGLSSVIIKRIKNKLVREINKDIEIPKEKKVTKTKILKKKVKFLHPTLQKIYESGKNK